jgi:hypothetical protein
MSKARLELEDRTSWLEPGISISGLLLVAAGRGGGAAGKARGGNV